MAWRYIVYTLLMYKLEIYCSYFAIITIHYFYFADVRIEMYCFNCTDVTIQNFKLPIYCSYFFLMSQYLGFNLLISQYMILNQGYIIFTLLILFRETKNMFCSADTVFF